MVRLQGDFAKPPEKRFNYKNCFDALFRMVREEGPSSFVGGVGPNIFCVILMNASQLAFSHSLSLSFTLSLSLSFALSLHLSLIYPFSPLIY
ncbi:hypothetical protein B0H13DRAFT_2305713 [Mycena leptocephala]|nr:hypothetical protein B0H13DRAFT_2305713 [Mycena leptocephala]